jgi:hypothetical protein
MKFRITTQTAPDAQPVTYIAIGNRDALMDAAYDSGALAVSIQVLP